MAVKAKICGLRLAADADLAARAGADFVGVILDEGPRQASAQEIQAVVDAAGPVPVMAVVVHAGPEDVLRLRDRCGFAGVQLHAGQAFAEARAYQQAGLLVWRTARLTAESDSPDPARFVEYADAVLVEPRVHGRAGGAGVALALDVARAARERLGPVPMILAGGLTAETVQRAVALVQPYAVDVSSGVERAPGVKDPDRLARFLEALRGNDSQT